MGTIARLFILMSLVLSPSAAWAEDKPALVLSGGGARGGAHLGVLRVLEEQQIKPDFIVVSFGALVGGLYAAGMDLDRIETVMADLDLTKTCKTAPSVIN